MGTLLGVCLLHLKMPYHFEYPLQPASMLALVVYSVFAHPKYGSLQRQERQHELMSHIVDNKLQIPGALLLFQKQYLYVKCYLTPEVLVH